MTGNRHEQGVDELDPDELMQTIRTRRDKVLRFTKYPENELPFTWYVAYRGSFGWSACRANGEWIDEPSEEDVRAAVEKYDYVKLIDRSDTPQEVSL